MAEVREDGAPSPTRGSCATRSLRDAEDFLQLRPRLVAAEGEIGRFAAVESDDVGEEADLRGRPVAVRAVDLPVDVPGVEEEHAIRAGRALFSRSSALSSRAGPELIGGGPKTLFASVAGGVFFGGSDPDHVREDLWRR